MTPDRPARRATPTQPPPSSSDRERDRDREATPAPANAAGSEPSSKPREAWIEQWLADEEDDVWNMPCTD